MRKKPQTNLIHSYGYIPDPPDERDYRVGSPPDPSVLAQSVDYRADFPAVGSQGALGSCTGWTLAWLRWYLEYKANPTPTPAPLSPLFVYYEELAQAGLPVAEDKGASLRVGMKVLNQIGCAPEALHPYSPKFNTPPSAEAIAAAAHYQITTYTRLDTTSADGIRAALIDGNVVALGINAYPAIERTPTYSQPLIPIPLEEDKPIGGHAVLCVGAVLDPGYPGGGYLIIRNSWGTSWGIDGYGYLPFAYVNEQRVPDAWIATR